MIFVTAGTDTYGRVKAVSGTPVVTQFAMFQFLPVFPLRSFYYLGTGTVERTGIPFLASAQTTKIIGIALASVDMLSVLMAYIRAVFAALAIIGFLAIVPGIMYLTGERLDEFAMIALRALLISLGTGTLMGVLTYLVPLTPRRERDIRRYCAEFLKVAIDPARVSSDTRMLIENWIEEPPYEEDKPRMQIIRELVSTRLKIAHSGIKKVFEKRTNELLEQLKKTEFVNEE